MKNCIYFNIFVASPVLADNTEMYFRVDSNYNNSKLSSFGCYINSKQQLPARFCSFNGGMILNQRVAKSRSALAAQPPIVCIDRIPHLGLDGGSNCLVGHGIGEAFGLRLSGDRERDLKR